MLFCDFEAMDLYPFYIQDAKTLKLTYNIEYCSYEAL